MTQNLLRVKDLQERLQLSRQGIYQMYKQKKLPKPLRIGRSIRWKPEAIEDFLKQKEREEVM